MAVLVTEAGLQLFYRVQQGAWLWDNSAFRIGYTQPIEGRRQYSLRPGYTDQKAGITIDALGFRRTPGVGTTESPFIVCIGDSVPFGAGVSDPETYPFKLAERLNAGGLTHRVINAGVPSYNLRQSFDRLEQDVLTAYPGVHVEYVIVEAANDISLLTYYGSEWTPEVTWAKVRWSESWGAGSLARRVALAHYGSILGGAVWSKVASKRTGNGIDAQAVGPAKGEEMLSHAEATLRTRLTELQRRGIRVAVLPINPFYYQLSAREKNPHLRQWKRMSVYVEGWDDLIRQYNDVVKAVSSEFPNATFLDMRRIMDADERDKLYIDYIHYSDEGHAVVAEQLFQLIRSGSQSAGAPYAHRGGVMQQ